MKEYTDTKYAVQEFDSMAEVAEYLENTKDLNDYKLTDNYMLSKRSSFYGVDTFDNELDRLRYGDKKTTSSYIKELGDIQSFEEQDTGIFKDVEGFAYDMGAVVNGEPECCLNFGSPEPKQSLNIYIDIGYCGETSKEIINNRGFAIVKLINSLMAKGVILNVNVVHYIETYDDGLYAQIIKIPTEFLTLSTIGFSGTTDFFRVISWLLTAIQMKDKSYCGEGKSEPSSEIIEAIKERGDLYIPSGYTDDRFNDCNKKEAENLVFEIYDEFLKRNSKE